MKKYKNFDSINKNDIHIFRGLENEVSFSPAPEADFVPLRVTKLGITYPNKEYYIRREPSPCFIIEYIVSGCGYLEINGEKHKLKSGDAYIIHPGDFCTYYADAIDPYKKYWINFSSGFFFTELLKAYDINDRVIREMDLSEFFDKLFGLEEIYETNDEICVPASEVIFSLLMKIAKHKKNDITSVKRDLAHQVRFLLNRSVSSSITIEDISKKLYRSKNDIIRQFKKKYNITPYNYLIELRIGRAKNLLVNSDKTLAEIANKLCFSSEYHFSNTFKKKTGTSPSEFRKNNR